MPWASHPADTVGTPDDPGLWTEAANVGASRVADLLEIAEGQIRAYAPALADGAPVPASYRIATVLQARDNWQASRRVGDSVAVGDTAYAIRVRPISDAIKSMVRPPEGVAGFASGASTFVPAPAVDLSAYALSADVAAGYAPLGHTHPDPWTYVVAATDTPVSSNATPVPVAGLVVPAGLPDGLYELEAMIRGRSALGGVGLQYSMAWGPTAPLAALTFGATSTNTVSRTYGLTGSFTSGTGNPGAGVDYLAGWVSGVFRATAMVDPISVLIRSSTEGSLVTALADSFFRYRRIAA